MPHTSDRLTMYIYVHTCHVLHTPLIGLFIMNLYGVVHGPKLFISRAGNKLRTHLMLAYRLHHDVCLRTVDHSQWKNGMARHNGKSIH